MTTHRFFIDGHPIAQQDRFGDGSRWFQTMLLPDEDQVGGPFTPVEFARHRMWGLDPAWATRSGLHAPMQRVGDTYNDGFWPVKQCEPSEHGQRERACTFTY